MPRVSTKNSSASQAARDLLPSKPVGRWLVVLTLVAAVLGVSSLAAALGADGSDPDSSVAEVPVAAAASAPSSQGPAASGLGNPRPDGSEVRRETAVPLDRPVEWDQRGPTSRLAGFVRPLGSALDVPTVVTGPEPVSITFDDIGVAGARIDAVGVLDDGQMEIPGADEVGWYRYGPRPGEPGSAVLAAHIAQAGQDGVFRRLSEATAGDRFSLLFDDGSSITYEVVDLAQYGKTDLPFDQVFAKDGPSVVTLITCGGAFQPSLRSYEDNVVVSAVAVAS